MRLMSAVCAAVCLFFAGVAWGSGQTAQPNPLAPTIVSGPDIGFRIEGRNGQTPIGTRVVRVDGKWVEPQFKTGIRPLTTK